MSEEQRRRKREGDREQQRVMMRNATEEQMNKGKQIVTERENGEEICAKDSMKLEGVQVKSNSVL